MDRFKKNPLNMLILGQKSCFFEPTIFEIPQPNWYRYIKLIAIVVQNLTVPYMSSSVSSGFFLQHLQHALQQEGTVQNSTLKIAKKAPHPTRLGPINLSSNVRKPLSPNPTNVMISPIDIIPNPTYRIIFALPLAR